VQLKDCPVPIYGDATWRGKCPPEHVEQVSFFSRLRREYPDSYGLIAVHPRNEGLKRAGQFFQRRQARGGRHDEGRGGHYHTGRAVIRV
jgi:hypothetical protein